MGCRNTRQSNNTHQKQIFVDYRPQAILGWRGLEEAENPYVIRFTRSPSHNSGEDIRCDIIPAPQLS